MISYIKTNNGHRESDNVFVFEYSIVNGNIQSKFDVDVHNYGSEVVGIKGKSDEEICMTDRDDVIEEQLDFVTGSSILSDLGNMVKSDDEMSAEEKIDFITKYIDEFCSKWELIHQIDA